MCVSGWDLCVAQRDLWENRRGAEYSHPPTPRIASLIYSHFARNRKMCATVSEAELLALSKDAL